MQNVHLLEALGTLHLAEAFPCHVHNINGAYGSEMLLLKIIVSEDFV